jgi:hypothetical protein
MFSLDMCWNCFEKPTRWLDKPSRWFEYIDVPYPMMPSLYIYLLVKDMGRSFGTAAIMILIVRLGKFCEKKR